MMTRRHMIAATGGLVAHHRRRRANGIGDEETG